MKKLILTIAIAFVGITAALAQQDSMKVANAPIKPKLTAEQRADLMTKRLDKQLSLSAEQRTKLYDIQLAHAKKMDELKAEKGAAKERKTAKEEEKAQIDALLTPEQKSKLDAFRAEAKERAGKMRKGLRNKDKPPVVSNPAKQG